MSNHHRSTFHVSEHTLTDAAELATLLSRSAVFLEPDRLVSPASWVEHIPFAFWLMDVLRPAVFVELGTHSGNSYAAFAQAVQHLDLKAAGYAIDTWKGDPHAGFYDESVFTEWRAYHDCRYASFSRLVRSTFDEAVGHFADRSVDLLNIDGYHTTEAVSHDFHAWLPKMSGRGVVLLHDINVREGTFGAWQVWEKLRASYPSFTFLHGHGLGVLAVGEDIPAPIAWLTGLDSTKSTDVLRVREFFGRIGGSILARSQLTAAIAELAASNARVSSLEAALGGAYAQASDLTQRLEGAEARGREAGEDAKEELRARNAEIAELGALLEQAAERATEENKRRAEELTANARANADAHNRLTELSEQLLNHTRARAVQESLSLALAQSLAAATAQIGALKARVSLLSQTFSRSPHATSTRIRRALATAQSLGATPRGVVRRPGSVRTLLRLALSPHRVRDAHLIANSGLFDAAYYLEQAPDVEANGLNPLAHFVLSGGVEGRSPHPLFDSSWYLARYEDVRASRMNPLAHYLRTASTEVRDPHPLFSTSYYRAPVPEATSRGCTPLEHYIRHGALEGRSPHPLFDSEYYIDTYGQALSDINPLVHFLDAGAASDFNPHPLFDTRYYRDQVLARQELAVNPLLHYMQSSSRREKPHPLFDPDFYLRSYKDVASSGIEPLTHFLLTGGAEGRRPGKEFDGAWYLSTYDDVAQSGANPLVHFVRYGWRERRNPSAQFDTTGYLGRYPDVAATGANPLVHYVEHGRVEGRSTAPNAAVEAKVDLPQESRVWLRTSNLNGSTRVERAVVCLTHVMPIHPRAGNEYRIHRMLRWLCRSGYVVIPIVAPTDGSQLTSADVRALADEYGNAVFCAADGQLEYVLRDVPDVLQSLNGESPRRWATTLGEDRGMTDRERELLAIDRTFCTDTLIATVLRLQSALGPYVLLAEYIWMSRVLPLVTDHALRVIDTIDVFSSRADKVGRYGIDDLTIEPNDETVRLERADLLIAIQENERRILEGLAPGVPTITSGVDFDVVADPGEPTGCQVLCVASGNPMNRRGLKDFLRFCWPRVRELVPTAELLVVGGVSDSVITPPPGVHILGKIADLSPLYQACRVAINPAVAGTGVKIKTLEALAHLRPIVTWPNGVDGLSTELARLCLTAHDWHSFGNRVAQTLSDHRPGWFSESDRETLRREGSPAHVYAPLGDEIQTFFARATALVEMNSRRF